MAGLRFWTPIPLYGIFSFAIALTGATSSQAAVTISTDVTQNMDCSAGVCTPTAPDAVLNENDLTSLLAGSNVQVNTGSGTLAEQVNDIVISAGFSWSGANSLTLDAYRSITFGQPVAVNGSGGVSLITNDGGKGGALSFIAGGSLSFANTTNSLSINGEAYTLANSVATLAADIASNARGRYALSASYDASQDGSYKNSPFPKPFKGKLNGLGNAIANLAIHGEKSEIGLFSYVDTKGEIDSLRVANANIAARNAEQNTFSAAGILAAVNYGTVFNSFTSGQISETARKAEDELDVGGLIANNSGLILDSGTNAIVQAGGRYSPFGITGGLVAQNTGTIKQSYATGSVSSNYASGGLAAFSAGAIENCYAEGDVTLSSSMLSYVGGLVGFTKTSISNSYSTGAPSGGSDTYVGGFVGYDNSSGGLSKDYWDTATSGITDPSQGAGNIPNDPGIKGRTTAQLQSGLPKGFDPKIWAEDSSINGGLPYLIANPPQ